MNNLIILLVYMLDHASSDWLPAYSQKKKKKKLVTCLVGELIPLFSILDFEE